MIKSSYSPDFTGCSQTSDLGKESVLSGPFGDCCRWDCLYPEKSEKIYSGNVSLIYHDLTVLDKNSSLWLSHPVDSGIVLSSFRIQDTSRVPDGTRFGLAPDPPPSAVWTFLPPNFCHSPFEVLFVHGSWHK